MDIFSAAIQRSLTKFLTLYINHIVDLTSGYDSNKPPSFIPSLPLCSGQMIQFQAQCLKDNISLYLTLRYVILLNNKLIFDHTIQYKWYRAQGQYNL